MTTQALMIAHLSTGVCFTLTSCSSTPAPEVSATTNAPLGVSSSMTAKPYPLDTCIVSDEPLESMGGSITKVYQGHEVKFCCQGCVKDFDATPEKFLAKLR